MKTILIVDDEYDIVSTLEMVFTMEGYQVSQATNGKEALALLSKGPKPDLMISDVMMPVMDGYEFAAALKADATLRDIPFILMSAAKLDVELLGSGSFDLFISKPFDLDVLLAKISQLLGKRRL